MVTEKEILDAYKKRKKGNSNVTAEQILSSYRQRRYGTKPKSVESERNNTSSDVVMPELHESPLDKYKEYANASNGAEGYQKYLDDMKAVSQPKTEEPEDKSGWEKFLDFLGECYGPTGVTDTTIPLSETPQIVHDLRENGDINADRPDDTWDAEAKNIFGALYVEDPNKAYEFAKLYNDEKLKAEEERKIKEIQETSTENPVLHTAGSIAAAPMALADFLNMVVRNSAGLELKDDGIITPGEYSEAVKQGIADDLNEKYGTLDEDIPIIGGKGWGDVYGLGTSTAQSIASAYALGGLGTMISYFGQSAASGVKDALDRGATDSQAILYGTALGVFEGLAEKIGVDNLFKLGGTDTLKGVIKNALKQAGAEGMEEGITSILSNIADNAIMQDKSNFNNLVKEYMANGMSEEEAKTKAWLKSVEGIAFDTIAGAISGGVSGSIQTGISNIGQAISDTHTGREILDVEGSKAQLLDTAKLLGDKTVDKFINKAQSGKLSQNQEARTLGVIDRNLRGQMSDMYNQANGVDEEGKYTREGRKMTTEQRQNNLKAIADSELGKAYAEYDVNSSKAKSEYAVRQESERQNTLKERQLVLPKNVQSTYDKGLQTYLQGKTDTNTAEKRYRLGFLTARHLGMTSKGKGITAMLNTLSAEDRNLILSLGDVAADAFDSGAAEARAEYEAARKKADEKRAKSSDSTKEKGESSSKSTKEDNENRTDNATWDKKVKNFGIDKTIDEKKLTASQKKDVNRIKRLAEALPSIDFIILNDQTDQGGYAKENGFYDAKSRTIGIYLGAGRLSSADVLDTAMFQAGTHEVVHDIKADSSEKFLELRDAVRDIMGADAYESAVSRRYEQYKANDPDFTRADAEEEVVANALEDILNSEEQMFRLSKGHKNIFSRIWQGIKDFFDRVFNAIGKFHAQSGESQLLDKLDKRYKKLEKTFIDILHSLGTETNSAEENLSENKKSSSTYEESNDVKKSIKSINEEIEKYQKRLYSWDGKTVGFSFVMGTSPSYLAEIEINGKKIGNKQVRIDATKIKAIIDNHPEMTIDIISQLPYLLNDPILVMDSKTVEGRLVLIGEVYSKERPVMMALEINPSIRTGGSNYVDVIKVASAYTRTNTQNLINSSKIRYICKNKDRVNTWLKVNRLQLPLPNSHTNSVINSISQNTSTVNRENEGISKNVDTDVKKSLKDTSSIESREAIVRSFGELAATDGEKKIVKDYAKSIEKIDKSIEKKKELFLGLQELKGKTDSESRAQREKYSAEIQRINDEITKADESLLKIAAAEPFRNVVRKSFESGYDKGFDAREGYILKTIAKHSHSRYYNKKDVAAAIEKAPKVDTLTHKRRGELADELTNKLNKAKNDGERAVITKDFIDKIQEEIITNDKNGALKDLSERELSNWKRSLVDALMDLYRKASKPGEFAGGVEAFIERQKHLLELDRTARSIREKKLGLFDNATQVGDKNMATLLRDLSAFEYRKTFSENEVRAKAGRLGQWYRSVKETLFEYRNAENPGLYSEAVEDHLIRMSSRGGKLSIEELQNLNNSLKYFIHFAETYDKVYKNGKLVGVREEAQAYLDSMKANEPALRSISTKNALSALAERYYRDFGEPMVIARILDCYDPSGFFTSTVEQLRQACIASAMAQMEIRAEYADFFENNKDFTDNVGNHDVSYRGVKIPAFEAMSLYMTLKREQSYKAFLTNGFTFNERLNGKAGEGKVVKVDGLIKNIIYNQLKSSEIEQKVAAEREKLYKEFTDKEKEYIRILEKGFSVCGELKSKRDIERMGYSETVEGYYYPLQRSEIAKESGIESFMDEIKLANSYSFTKHSREGTAIALKISSADDMFNRHVRGICDYMYVSSVIDYYDRVRYANTSTKARLTPDLIVLQDNNSPESIHSYLTQHNSKDRMGWIDQYINDIFADVKGKRHSDTVSNGFNQLIGKLRSAKAVSLLAGNIKVWCTQLSSLIASCDIISPISVVKGITLSGADVDNYCNLAALRNAENTAFLAQAVASTKVESAKKKFDHIVDTLMKPIGAVDRLVVEKVFAACQIEVAKDGPAFGTEENKQRAGKLLEKVIFETQQNTFATEKSAAMRSGNELVRGLTMFTSDAMKLCGRVIESYSEFGFLRSKLAHTKDASEQAKIKSRMSTVRGEMVRRTGVLLASSVYLTVISTAFQVLYGRIDLDDEEEVKEELISMLFSIPADMLGGLPIISDFVSYFKDGYEMESFSLSAINDLWSGAKSLYNLAVKASAGKIKNGDVTRAFKNVIFGVAHLFGVPARNVWNLVRGVSQSIGGFFGAEDEVMKWFDTLIG